MDGERGKGPNGVPGSPGPGRLPDPQAPSGWVRGTAATLLVLGAAAAFGSLLVVGLLVLGSMWEGGDQALKHRMLLFGPLGGLGNFASGVLLCVAVGPVAAGRSAAWPLLKACALVAAALTAGWAAVLDSSFVTGLGDAAGWALFAAPPLLAALVYRCGTGPADGPETGLEDGPAMHAPRP